MLQNDKRTWLIKLRKERGLKQSEVANFIGTSSAFYTFIENGTRRPSPEVAQKLGKVLNFDWTRFYQKTRSQTKEE